MVRHIFLDKTNTIVEGSKYNVGLNPVLHLGYGQTLMRGLVHFDLTEIKKMIKNKTIADITKMKCTLKMTNCLSVDSFNFKGLVNGKMQRASSFDIIAFKLPCNFDQGRGYDFIGDFWYKDSPSLSTDGSSWYFAKNAIPWKFEADKYDLRSPASPKFFQRATADHFTQEIITMAKSFASESADFEEDCNWSEVKKMIIAIAKEKELNNESLIGGIYPTDILLEEYDKFLDGQKSIVIGSQHFDYGNENLSIDITKYVSELYKRTTDFNYGIGLAFAPRFEYQGTELEQYVGFFTDHTNTFFHPYVEVVYNEAIKDDRESFTIGKENELYLYVFDEDVPVNLDNLPTCTIEGVDMVVRQVTKGVYKAIVPPNALNLEPATIYVDKWSQIALNGVQQDDVELEFSTRPKEHKITIGDNSNKKVNLVPIIYGINDKEKIRQGDVRELTVDFRRNYSTEIKELISSAEYRLYVKDGNRELDVIDYKPIEKTFLNNYFTIYTQDLVPNEYYIDIKVKAGREVKIFNKILRFSVSDNITERYE